MIQEAFSQTSQVTDSMWSAFEINGSVKTLGRSSSRNNFVNLLMLSEGYPFDSLFSTDPRMAKTRAYYGKKAHELLSQGMGNAELEEIFRKAGENLMGTELPGLEIAEEEITMDMDEPTRQDADQSNQKTEQNVGRAGAMATLIQDYFQFQPQSLKDYMKQSVHSETHQALDESLLAASAYCDSVNNLGTFQKSLRTSGTSSMHPGNYIKPRFYLEYVGHQFAHSTLKDASQKISSSKIENLGINVLRDIDPMHDQDALAFAADPLTKNGRDFGFALDENGNLYKAPSKDIQEIRLKLNDCRNAQGNLTSASVYDSLSQMFSKNPMEQGTEELLKRLYVNGENAYDKYRRRERSSLVSIPDVIRAIVGDITRGEARVELVRLEGDLRNGGPSKPVILPIHVDYTGTAATPQAISAHEQLWQNDPEKEARREKIAAAAIAHQKRYAAEVHELNTLYSTVAARTEKAMRGKEPYAGQYKTLELAQQVMAENPDETREWVQLKMKQEQNLMMKELAQAATVFWAGPEENPQAFSSALDTLNLYGKIWVEEMDILAPSDQNAIYAFDAIRKLASMDEKDRAAEFYRLFHELSGHEDALNDTTENRLRGLQTSLRYFMDKENESVLTAQEKNRLEELDRKYLGFAEGEASKERYLGAEKVYADARALKRDALDAMTYEMVKKITVYSQQDFPPEQTRLCLKSLDHMLSAMNLTREDLDRYVESMPQEVKKDHQDTLAWIRTNQARDLRAPLDVEGISMDKMHIFRSYTALCVNAVMYRDGYADCDNRAIRNQLNRWREHRIEQRQKELEGQPLRQEVSPSHRSRTNLANLQAQESEAKHQSHSPSPAVQTRRRAASQAVKSGNKGMGK